MQKLDDRETFSQAQTAVQQGNWSFLSQCVQQLLSAIDVVSQQTPESTETLCVEQLLPLALAVLEAGEFQDRWEIAKVFPRLGECAIAPLIELLQEEEADLELRWFVARILGDFNHPTVVMALVESIRTCDSQELNEMTAQALANLGIAAIAPLADLLADPSTRLLAVQALAQIRHSQTIPYLLSVVDDAQPTIRATAIEALSSFHDPRIAPTLAQALTDPVAKVRQTAVTGLGLRTDLLPDLDLVSLLQPHLYDLNLQVCHQAAIALGRLRTHTALVALFQLLQTSTTPESLQIEAVRALGRSGSPEALEYLHQAWVQRTPTTLLSAQVCQEIVGVLGRIEEPALKSQATHLLIELIHAPDPTLQQPSLKQAIALSLGQLADHSALEPLVQLLAEPDMGMKLHAIAALKKLNAQAVRRHLEDLAQSENLPDDLKEGIGIALAEW